MSVLYYCTDCRGHYTLDQLNLLESKITRIVCAVCPNCKNDKFEIYQEKIIMYNASVQKYPGLVSIRIKAPGASSYKAKLIIQGYLREESIVKLSQILVEELEKYCR